MIRKNSPNRSFLLKTQNVSDEINCEFAGNIRNRQSDSFNISCGVENTVGSVRQLDAQKSQIQLNLADRNHRRPSQLATVVGRTKPVPMEFVNIGECYAESGVPEGLLQKYGLMAEAIVATVQKVRSR